jgi:hypothetical protein
MLPEIRRDAPEPHGLPIPDNCLKKSSKLAGHRRSELDLARSTLTGDAETATLILKLATRPG